MLVNPHFLICWYKAAIERTGLYKLTVRLFELGYELDVADQLDLDPNLCPLFRAGSQELFDEGLKRMMFTANSRGDSITSFLTDLTDKDGKIAPRLVDSTPNLSDFVSRIYTIWRKRISDRAKVYFG